MESLGSSFSIETRLDDRGLVPGSGNDGIFSLRHRVQTLSGAYPTTSAVGTGGYFRGVKAVGA